MYSIPLLFEYDRQKFLELTQQLHSKCICNSLWSDDKTTLKIFDPMIST